MISNTQRINTYKDLIFWQRAHEASIAVIKLSRKLPRDRVADILISQIIRSSVSVGANIAEGYGRYKSKEYGRFLQIALGSANETDYWLTMLHDSYSALTKEIDIIILTNMETIKMLASSLKTLRNKK